MGQFGIVYNHARYLDYHFSTRFLNDARPSFRGIETRPALTASILLDNNILNLMISTRQNPGAVQDSVSFAVEGSLHEFAGEFFGIFLGIVDMRFEEILDGFLGWSQNRKGVYGLVLMPKGRGADPIGIVKVMGGEADDLLRSTKSSYTGPLSVGAIPFAHSEGAATFTSRDIASMIESILQGTLFDARLRPSPNAKVATAAYSLRLEPGPDSNQILHVELKLLHAA
jgi:hypothetical protein